MSYWNTLPPTKGQLRAIESYNKYYGIKLKITTKQQAHDVISKFAPNQKLDFNVNFVEGTDVSYDIINETLFSNYKRTDAKRLKNVKNIKIIDGTAIITIRRNNNNNLLSCLNNNMDKMLNEPSLSEYEDSLGYLDEQELSKEQDIYGPDPMWWH